MEEVWARGAEREHQADLNACPGLLPAPSQLGLFWLQAQLDPGAQPRPWGVRSPALGSHSSVVALLSGQLSSQGGPGSRLTSLRSKCSSRRGWFFPACKETSRMGPERVGASPVSAHPGPVAGAKERLCLGSVTGRSGVQGMVCLGRCGCHGQQREDSVCGRPATGRPSREGHCGARAEQSPGRHGRAGAASLPQRLWLAREGRALLRPATSPGHHQRRGWFQKNTFVIFGALPNVGQ